NCVPSLHTAWGIALWWTCPRNRWLRFGLAAYLFFMFLYTLASGHYLVDMIVAVPFTLAAYACTRGSEADFRHVGAISGGIFLVWLALLRFTSWVFLASPV